MLYLQTLSHQLTTKFLLTAVKSQEQAGELLMLAMI